MSRYSEECKRDTVALYENNEDLSLKSVSTKLGINQASLHSWVKKYGTGKRSRTKALHDKAQVANDS
uniref:transposase n=1 Tax=Corynebacterium propinquum TaxID=43769 RepID=UPI000A53B2A0